MFSYKVPPFNFSSHPICKTKYDNMIHKVQEYTIVNVKRHSAYKIYNEDKSKEAYSPVPLGLSHPVPNERAKQTQAYDGK